jgi:hypothetical protein
LLETYRAMAKEAVVSESSQPVCMRPQRVAAGTQCKAF